MALSHPPGTVVGVAWAKSVDGKTDHLVSASGHVLSRRVTFQVTLDPTLEQSRLFDSYAGARRFVFNHHIARVKHNLDVRRAEAVAGVTKDKLTPALSWSAVSLINHVNGWKNGQLDDSPVNDDGTRGLLWRDQVAADVFECASVDAATALKNFSESRTGKRVGARVGFPKFKARHRTTPTFRLRSKSKPGETAPIRFVDGNHIKFPVIGPVHVHGNTRKLRRMLGQNPDGTVRFHIYSATFTKRAGRWVVSLNGVAAELHSSHHSQKDRHPVRVGVDRGVADGNLAVAADADGKPFLSGTAHQNNGVWKGVKALRAAEQKLRRANKTLARTKPGSKGRAKARARVAKLHRKVANVRRHWIHQISHDLVTVASSIAIEDLNVAGMVKNLRLAKSISDAAMAELGRQLTYKAAWHGVELVKVDRWFPSSKSCSGCGHKAESLKLSDRTYRCEACGLELDRDLNAAVNLARWEPHQAQPPSSLTTAA